MQLDTSDPALKHLYKNANNDQMIKGPHLCSDGNYKPIYYNPLNELSSDELSNLVVMDYDTCVYEF